MYFVAGMAMENVVLKFEQREHKKQDTQFVIYKMYNDSLSVSLNETLMRSENAFSLDEYGNIVKDIVKESERSIKRYVKSENKKQEEEFEVFYFINKNDSAFKMLTYRGTEGYIIIRQVAITDEEMNRYINN